MVRRVRSVSALGTGLGIAALVALAGNASGGEIASKDAGTGVSLTIYSSSQPGAITPEMYRPIPGQGGGYRGALPGYATVRDTRMMGIKADKDDLATVRFTDVAALIDPTTVTFQSLEGGGVGAAATRVLEQNYQFDLVSSEKLLQKFVDQPINVKTLASGAVVTTAGQLLTAEGGQITLKTDNGVKILSRYDSVELGALPAGLITKPTLVWNLYSPTSGDQKVRVSYQTGGITWWTDYNMTFTEGADANSGTLDVGAWVSIINQSGASYNDAQLKLVAGEVQRAKPQRRNWDNDGLKYQRAAEVASPAGFEEKAFFEYHLYTLGRPTTLPENSTKQIELFPAAMGVPCEKLLVFDGMGDVGFWGEPLTEAGYGANSDAKVGVFLKFKNDEKNGLGIPMPAGRIRVSKADTDGSLEFIGEDVIKHTPRNEEILIKLGDAFDVVGERRQVDYDLNTSAKRITEVIEVKVRNRKKEPVKVVVQEKLYRWSTATITKSTVPATMIDAKTAHFPLTLEPNGEGVVTYTVRYTW